ncbi:MAG: hypothetical protein RR505_05365 [Raoultibacter sp.]
MRMIINNKVYDTDTAKLLGSFDNGERPGDLHSIEQALYRKKTGEYFVFSEGGAATRYATKKIDGWSSGWDIDPMGYRKAKEWAEENLSAEEYEAAFGIPTEGTAAVTVELSAAAKLRLEGEASESGRSYAQIIEALIEKL